MLLSIAAAVALQLETGWVHMSSAPDDFWYEQALPHTTDFDSQPFGAGLRLSHGPGRLTVGWRNLGNQHQHALIIADAPYFACRSHPADCPKPVSYWDETGSEQQVYAEVGYAFNLGLGWKLVPGIGFGETRITSHVQLYSYPALKFTEQGGGNVQWLPRYFAGITLEKGPVGVGVQYLQTEPNRGANSWTSPIQGSSAIYVRVTYAFQLAK
jgi:hypothetical protein